MNGNCAARRRSMWWTRPTSLVLLPAALCRHASLVTAHRLEEVARGKHLGGDVRCDGWSPAPRRAQATPSAALVTLLAI